MYILIAYFYCIHFTLTHSVKTIELHVYRCYCISCLQVDIKKYAMPEVCPEMTCTYLLHNTSTSVRTTHDEESFSKTLQLSVCFLCLGTDGSSRTEGLMGVSVILKLYCWSVTGCVSSTGKHRLKESWFSAMPSAVLSYCTLYWDWQVSPCLT